MTPDKMRFGYLAKSHAAEIGERPLPEMGPNDVLVKQLANNICTTDYQQWMGLREHQGYPMAGGHEGAGFVVAAGSNVKTVAIGDMVGVMNYGCKDCEICRSGNESLCTSRVDDTPDGYKYGAFGFADYMVRESRVLIKLNKDRLSPSEAGFLEPLATVVHGMKKFRVQAMETIVVLGAGTMGLVNALAARAYGARVIVTELMPKKLDTARSMGFEVVDSTKGDPVKAVKDLTGGKGPDGAIVAVGATAANDQGLAMIKDKDGRVMLFAAGYPKPELHVDSNAIHYNRTEIIGTFGADSVDFYKAADMLNSGAVNVSKLVEPKKFKLAEIQDAFEAASVPGMYRVSVLLND